MNRFPARVLLPGMLVACVSVGAPAQDSAPPPLTAPREGAVVEDRADLIKSGDIAPLPAVAPAAHEAFRSLRTPPAPITERPSEPSPGPKAVWIKGYWEWDEASKDFAWAVGGWRVPPAGKIWVNGSWKRDEKGWYRVPGSWTDQAGFAADWQRDGPPIEHPADVIESPPRSTMFHVPGIYTPQGNRLVWTPSYWEEARAGWDYVPSRWIQRADGWSFRPGSWVREDSDSQIIEATSTTVESVVPSTSPMPTVRHEVARPLSVSNLPPALPGEAVTDRMVESNSGSLPGTETTRVGTTTALIGATTAPIGATTAPASSAPSPTSPPAPASTYVMILPDGRRVITTAQGQVVPPPPPAPGNGPPDARRPPARGAPLSRIFSPLRRRTR